MKYIYVICCFFCANVFAHDMSGCWINETNAATYDLVINESGGVLSGKYCFINSNGRRIDCDKDSSLIDGKINDGVGIVSFGGSGEGRLNYINDNLILEMTDTKPFDDFNMHIPKEIKLSRADSCK